MVKLKVTAFIIILVVTASVLGSLRPGLAGSMGTSNADFLLIAPGAGPAAMGGAYTALAQDVNAAFWNPAGLAPMEGRRITLMHLAWFESLNYEFLAYAQDLGPGQGIGGYVVYFWAPEFNSTEDENGVVLDPASGRMYDAAAGLSCGYSLGDVQLLRGRTYIGGTLKFINRQLMDMSMQSIGVDIGIMVEAENGLVVGLTALNLGTEIEGEQSPFTVKLGLGLPLRMSSNDHQFRLALDIVKPIDYANWEDHTWKTCIGFEYLLLQSFAFRGGYQSGEDLAGVTAGIGIRFHVLQLDYAFAPYGVLGYTHRISLSLNFPTWRAGEKSFQDKDATPEFQTREEDLSVVP
jgi:hypothetical protein